MFEEKNYRIEIVGFSYDFVGESSPGSCLRSLSTISLPTISRHISPSHIPPISQFFFIESDELTGVMWIFT